MNRVWLIYEKTLRLFGFQKFGNAVDIIRTNGGLINSIWKIAKYDDLKKGTLVGVDDFGNRYYQNDYYFFGRNRWVEYADHVVFEYDASQVTPDWYGWLHYKTDYIPTQDPYRPNYPWILKASENHTGTDKAFMPYSTTKPKVTLWEPKSKPRT